MRRVLILAAIVVVGGCARQSVEPRRVPPAPESSGTEARARGITSKQFDSEHRPVWSLEMAKGRMSLDEHSGSGVFTDVAGKFFSEGREAAALAAKSGSADSATGIVRTGGGVVLRSLMQGADIRARSVDWRSKDNIVVASGNVLVTRGPFVMREPGAVFADTAARKVWIRSKEGRVRSAKGLLPLAAVAAVAAHGRSVMQFGSVTIDGYTEMSGNLSDPNVIRASCKGPAVHLSAPDYGIDIVASQLDATILPKVRGRDALRAAKASGSVRFAFSGSAAGAGDKFKSASGTSDHADYDGVGRTLTLEGTVRLDVKRSDDIGAGIHADAETAVVTFAKAGDAASVVELTDQSGGKLTMPPSRVVTGFNTAHVDRSDPALSRVALRGRHMRFQAPERGLDLTASRLDLTFVEATGVPDNQRLRTAYASGGLKFELAGLADVVKPDNQGRTVRGAKGSANELTYSRADGTLVLKGDVDLLIDADWFESPGMRSTGDEAVVHVDPVTNAVLSFDLSNKSGRGTASGTAKKEAKKQ